MEQWTFYSFMVNHKFLGENPYRDLVKKPVYNDDPDMDCSDWELGDDRIDTSISSESVQAFEFDFEVFMEDFSAFEDF